MRQLSQRRQKLQRTSRRRLIQQLVTGTNLEAFVVGEPHEARGGVTAFDERLLDVDMTARFESLLRQRLVRVWRGADMQDVEGLSE